MMLTDAASMSLYVRIILETLLLLNNFQCHTISGTGKVDSVIIFNILGLQKLSSLD